MAYGYQLGYSVASKWVPVTVEFELATLAELKARVKQDTGSVPDWLETCPRAEYLGVEHEYQVDGRWYVAAIEGREGE